MEREHWCTATSALVYQEVSEALRCPSIIDPLLNHDEARDGERMIKVDIPQDGVSKFNFIFATRNTLTHTFISSSAIYCGFPEMTMERKFEYFVPWWIEWDDPKSGYLWTRQLDGKHCLIGQELSDDSIERPHNPLALGVIRDYVT